MSRYIDVDKLYEEMLNTMAINALEVIKRQPIADVAPVVHAHWIDTEDYTNHYGHIYECSNCHREVADNFIVEHTYCLHCGAKMDKEKESDG